MRLELVGRTPRSAADPLVGLVGSKRTMKQKITITLDKQLLKKARALAAQRNTSLGTLLSNELEKLVEQETEYEQAKTRALALLSSPFRLGGKIANRESLHDR